MNLFRDIGGKPVASLSTDDVAMIADALEILQPDGSEAMDRRDELVATLRENTLQLIVPPIYQTLLTGRGPYWHNPDTGEYFEATGDFNMDTGPAIHPMHIDRTAGNGGPA